MAVSTALATTKLAAGGGAGLGLLAAGSGLMAPLLVTTAALAAGAYAGFRYVTWPTCGKCA
ncbi:MAG: hypothetical protein HQL34_08310, partial [Alphaproteobacteria bacterium]|nr:hypothetical protein [Alphaproteobacteria bacterium]